MKKNESLTIKKLFDNNKFVFALSLISAIIIWLIVAIEVSPEATVKINDVKVSIDLTNSVPAQFGLQIFGEKEFYVDVTVTGKKYIVSSLSADDIVVSAQTNYVDSAGKAMLQLKAVPKDDDAPYTIMELSEKTVDVYFDSYKEVEFPIKAEIVTPSGVASVAEDCVQEQPVISISTVLISGAATEINKINGVYASVSLTEPLAATRTFSADIKIVDDVGGGSFKYLSTNISGEVTVTIPVLKNKELAASLTFKNMPSEYVNNSLVTYLSPKRFLAAVPVAEYDTLTSVSVGTVDFSQISNERKVLVFEKDSLQDAKVQDDTKRFTVIVDASAMQSAQYAIPVENISMLNVPAEHVVSLHRASLPVTVIGPQSDLDVLTGAGIYAELDFTGVSLTQGENQLTARIIVKTNTTCWAYGTYKVNVNVQ
ncbi:MAG: hypothetical protein GX051_00695 [Clostridiales bacterium]|nr:hypothetical protein [Clostridiales bacterium]